MEFSTPISEIPRIGPVYVKRLKQLGITTVRDLLFHFPRSYEDFSKITPVQEIREGNIYCVCGTILEIQEVRTFRKRISLIKAILKDDTGAIRVLWFNQPYLTTTLDSGLKVCLVGKILRDKEGIYLASPSYEKIPDLKTQIPTYELTHMGRIVPVYPETAGVSSRFLRSTIKFILAKLQKNIPDSLPFSILKARKLPPLYRALWQIHFPNSLELKDQTRKRFAFEELFYISLFILSERQKIASVKAPPIPLDVELMKKLTQSLPFQLTDSQKKAAWQILKDLEKPRPMNRLLQGDVGSGKTVVATMAALSTVKAGYQVAFMSPTEILAKQHFKTVSELLQKFKVNIGLLTGKADRFVSKKLPTDVIEISRGKLLQKAKNREMQILIGTHALIQDNVRFGKLGLIVIDEQHRFGVKQRAKLLLTAKRTGSTPAQSQLIPHLLSMTATPIPRTLAMTMYGDLDLSLIAELPKGRKKIETRIIPPLKRTDAYVFIRKEIQKGRQVFVICPKIEKTEHTNILSERKAVKEEYAKLSKEIFPDLRVEMLHGKMASRAKEEVMKKFKAGKIDILVSTSVVEVGVDIPNASVMMIEGTEHFGLSQLHQFRGRVGRSEHQSYCFLFTESPSWKTRQRLKALVETDSGFELAERDLKLRGPGDFAGTKQWGLPDFAMEQLANLPLVQEARETAKELLEKDITLQKYPLLRVKVQELRERLHLE